MAVVDNSSPSRFDPIDTAKTNVIFDEVNSQVFVVQEHGSVVKVMRHKTRVQL